MSHEKGIEAAAREFRRLYKYPQSAGKLEQDDREQATDIIAAYLAAAQPTRDLDSLRAALARCHALLQDAGHWIDMDAHAEWHEAMDKELLPCDEGGACPTVATSEGEEREAFEAWCNQRHPLATVVWNDDGPPHLSHDGKYYGSLADAWLAWQARSTREGGKR